MQSVVLNSFPLVPHVVLFCGVTVLFFFAFIGVYRSQQATETSRQKPVYGLPHMFAVSLRAGQAGNERLLLRGEKARLSVFLCLQPFSSPSEIVMCRSPLFSVSLCLLPVFQELALENVMQVCPWEGVEGFFCLVKEAIHPLPTVVQLDSTLESFRCQLLAKHLFSKACPFGCMFVLSQLLSGERHGTLQTCGQPITGPCRPAMHTHTHTHMQGPSKITSQPRSNVFGLWKEAGDLEKDQHPNPDHGAAQY